MRPHQSFSVVPHLPESLERLRELAWNLRFSWDPATCDVFRMMDPDLWDASGQNPVLFLGRISQARLEECGQDDAILANLHRVWNDYAKYRGSHTTWFSKSPAAGTGLRIGYFSAEFGLAACLPLYSGGLGVLAGDSESATISGSARRGRSPVPTRSPAIPPNDGGSTNCGQRPQPAASTRAGRARPGDRPASPARRSDLAREGLARRVGRATLVLLDTNILQNRPGSARSRSTSTAATERASCRYTLGVGGLRALALGMGRPLPHERGTLRSSCSSVSAS
jgi:hypothetical protein